MRSATDTKLQNITKPHEAVHEAIPGIFVAMSRFVKSTSGATSMCTHEYLRTIAAAGFRLETVTFEVDRRLSIRLKRKLRPQPYRNQIPPFVGSEVAALIRKTGARFVFLFDTAPLAACLRAKVGKEVQIVMLSNGLESVDHLHKMRAQKSVADVFKAPYASRAVLADKICAEESQRRYIDHVFCLSPFEVEIERWIGTKAATWLPRTISSKPLPWQPQQGRIGFVGSISHEPNIEGLLQFAKALDLFAPKGFSLRVVGGPEEVGQALAQRFHFIEYLGPLSEPELEREAATWSCFVHPLFCWACGCSIKLGVALGWQIPIVTTPAGRRGYTWNIGELPLAETPEGLARLALSMIDLQTAAATKREVQQVAGSCPTVEQVGGIIRNALLVEQTTAVRAEAVRI
jgi:hypothetical protein